MHLESRRIKAPDWLGVTVLNTGASQDPKGGVCVWGEARRGEIVESELGIDVKGRERKTRKEEFGRWRKRGRAGECSTTIIHSPPSLSQPLPP